MAERTYFALIGKRRKGEPSEVPREKISKVIEDYPNRILAEVTDSQHKELSKQGFRVDDLSSRTKIRIGSWTVDPKISTQRAEAVGPTEEEGALKAEYHFIQFIGPVKSEWLKNLKLVNLTPLSYCHDFTYLVHGKSDDVKKIEKRPFVRATMPYAPNLKITSETKSIIEEESEREAREFWILIFTAARDVQQTIARLKDLGAELLQEQERSGFYQQIHVRVALSVLNEIARLPDVYSIEPFHPPVDEDEVADMIVATGQVPAPPPPGTNPYLDWLNNIGVDGTGVTIGIVEASSRFNENHPAFTGRVTTLTARAKGNHATMVAGQSAGNYLVDTDNDGFIFGLGIAPAANLLNQWIGDGTDVGNCRDTVTNSGPNGENGTIQNNSWGAGTDDPMDYQSREQNFDLCVRDSNDNVPANIPFIICFSAGNSGNSGLTRPKGAKNIITTGNFENSRTGLYGCGDLDADNINELYIKACLDSGTGASSIGNCGDGRVKPDLVCAGQWTASASFNITAVSWPQRFINNQLAYGGGTSAASPKTAAACALVLQWWRQRHTVDAIEHTPSPALVKAMLINGAVDTGEGGPIPNMEQGWGRINLNNVFNPEMPAIYVDQNILLQPSSLDIEFDIEPIDTNQPMKITLVWTDVPGAIGSGRGADPNIPGDTGNPALVNELGLEVSQGANTWLGNNFVGGWSQTGGVQDGYQNACPDRIVNNVQNVFLQSPSGVYHVRISPESINGNCLDPANPTNLPYQQDFALAIQNVRLKSTEPLDVMLAIDRTGSMSGDRIAAAIASGKEFFDLIPTGVNHRAGLVSYEVPCGLPHSTPLDNKVTVDVDMDTVTDSLKTSAQDAIDLITAAGCTSIGAGLTKAMQRIVDNGEALHRKVIVLLSDGKENRPPYVNDILPLLRKEYRVHAVGLGGSINAALMQQIADDTHGEFLHTLDPDEIALLYQQVFALESDEEIVGQESGSFGAGEEEESDGQIKKFPVVNSDSQATFVVTWKNPAVNLEVDLVTPKGKTITPTDAQGSQTTTYVKRDTHVIYTLQKPGGAPTDWEGEWSVKIRRASGSATVAETYTASLLVSSTLRLALFWDKLKYFTKDLIRINTKVIDKQYVLKDGVKMTVRTTMPAKGYGAILADAAKKPIPTLEEDKPEGTLGVLDRLSEEEWKGLYRESEEVAETTFEVGIGDTPERPAIPVFATPHYAKLQKLFRPLKDGIYTYRIKVEGRTSSGARYTRMRTISKYVGAKADPKKSTVVLHPVKPQEPKMLRLTFVPKDFQGNVVGPGRASAIKTHVENGSLRGKVEDLLDGSYVMNFEAAERPEDMAVSIVMDEICIPLRVPIGIPSVPAPSPIVGDKLEGKLEQLRFDEKGNFLGFTLRTIDGLFDMPSISCSLAEVLTEAIEKNLTLCITRDESTGEVTELRIESP